MTRFHIACFAALCAPACASEVIETSTGEQADMSMQGRTLQGMTLYGTALQGMTMQGFRFDEATLNDLPLVDLRVQQGELVAEQNHVTLHGAALVGAHLYAQVRNLTANPPASTLVEYQITSVEAEASTYDPTHTGSTFLYTLTQNVDNTGSWQPTCPADADGHRVAIPLAATWNERGDRIESSSLFTFGCTTGTIAKCYRWGYRPWVSGYGDLTTMHWACTRMARADYCGDGVSHTREGTVINVWDNLGAPGPIERRGGLGPPLLMLFEAGWTTTGAVCLSRARWLLDGLSLAVACPARLIPLGLLGATVCDKLQEVAQYNPTAHLFDDSYIQLGL